MVTELCKHIVEKKVKLGFDDKNKTTLCHICHRIVEYKNVPKEFFSKKYAAEWVDYFNRA